MGQVIKFPGAGNQSKQSKNSAKTEPRILPTKLTRKSLDELTERALQSSFQNESDDRMQRIRASLEKINQLMAELKNSKPD